jgi:hypothetical protein
MKGLSRLIIPDFPDSFFPESGDRLPSKGKNILLT